MAQYQEEFSKGLAPHLGPPRGIPENRTQMATGASLLVGSAVWALWETAGLQGYEGNAQGTASLPSSSVNFLSIFSLPSLTDQLRGSPINCLSLPNSYNTLHLTLSTCHRQPPVTHGY